MLNPKKVWNGDTDVHAAWISRFEQILMGNKENK